MESFGLWRFSLAVYGSPDVPPICLRLQDKYDADVNVLLFALWLGQMSVRVSTAELAGLTQVASQWHAEVVRPMRHIRQTLKGHAFSIVEDAVETFRQGVKSRELAAEKLEQEILQAAANAAFDGLTFVSSQDDRARDGLSNAITYCNSLCDGIDDDDRAKLQTLAERAAVVRYGRRDDGLNKL